MSSFLATALVSLVNRLTGRSSDTTANRRRRIYKDKIWTAVEQLEDRTLLSGTVASTNFNSGLPSNAHTVGSASYRSSNTDVTLTVEGVQGQQGSLIFDSLGSRATSFEMSARIYIGGDASGGDGLSMGYGDLSGAAFSEGGENTRPGVWLSIDTYRGDSTNGEVAIYYKANAGASTQKLGSVLINGTSRSSLAPDGRYWISLSVSNTGVLTYTHPATGTQSVFLSGWDPQSNWRFGLGARTGAATDQHVIDELYITDTSANVVPSVSTSQSLASFTDGSGVSATLGWTVSDPNGNLSQVAATIRRSDGSILRSSSITNGLPTGAGTTSGSLTLSSSDGPGVYTFNVSANDNTGLSANGTQRTVTITDDDFLAPNITISGSVGTELDSLPQQFTWTIVDEANGGSVASGTSSLVTVTKNGSQEIFRQSYTTSGSSSVGDTFNFDSWGVGDYRLSITATDGDADRANDSLQSTVTRLVTVVANQPPILLELNRSEFVINENTDTTSRIAVATINVTDDPYGVNSLGLAGANAGDFEIENGTLYLRAGTTLDFEQQDRFDVTVVVDDASVGQSPDAVTHFILSVANVDEPPVVQQVGNATVSEGGEFCLSTDHLLTTDSEQSANALVYALTAAPSFGTLIKTLGPDDFVILGEDATFTQEEIEAGFISYVHDGGEAAADSFSFTVSDGTNTTSESTFVITVTPVNDVPTIDGPIVETLEDTAVDIDIRDYVSDADSDNDGFSFELLGAQNGTARIVSPFIVQFTPSLNYFGEASISVRITDHPQVVDGVTNTVDAVLRIQVAPVNDTPVVAVNESLTVSEGGSRLIDSSLLQTTDVDASSSEDLVYTVTAETAHGSLWKEVDGIPYELSADDTFTQTDLDAGLIRYTHDAGETSSDAFRFTVSDGENTTDEGTFAIIITPVNDVPTFDGPVVETLEDTAVEIDIRDYVTDADSDNDGFSFELLGAENGTARIVSPFIMQFTPSLNYFGEASISVRITDHPQELDGPTNTVEAAIRINVTAVNDAPVLVVNAPLTVNEAGSGLIQRSHLELADVDVASTEYLLYTVTAAPLHGVLWKETIGGPVQLADGETFTQADLDAGRIRYQHDGSETTADTYAFEVTDGEAVPQSAAFSIDVTPVADPPIVAVDDAATVEDTLVHLDVSAVLGSVGGNEVLSIVIAGIPTGAVLSDGTNSFPAGMNGNGDSVDVTSWNLESLTFRPPDDRHFTTSAPVVLTVIATATELNGSSATVSRSLEIVVDAVADTPDVAMADVEGTEDQPIAINLSNAVTLNDTDGSESVTSLIIANVPIGARITDGNPLHVFISGSLGETNTSVDVVGWNLASLTITPPLNSHHDFDLRIIATSTDAETAASGRDSAVNETTFHVVVIADADVPTLTPLANSTGLEIVASGDVIGLNLGAVLNDLDGSESLTLLLKGIPAGAVLSDGSGGHRYPTTSEGIANPNDWVDITDWNWAELTIRPTQYDDTDFTLTVKAIATEAENGDTAEIRSDIQVTVRAVANAPNLEVWDASTNEDQTVSLRVETSRVDDDGSETLALVVSGIPVGATISDGNQSFQSTLGQTSKNITSWALANLSITPPLNDSRNFTLTFTATTTEGDATAAVRTAQTVRTLDVTVHPVNDAPVVSDFVAPTIDQTGLIIVDLRQLVVDVETADDDLVFSNLVVVGGLAMGQVGLGLDRHTAYFLPNPDFVGIASFQFSVTDSADFVAAEPNEVDNNLLTRGGTVSAGVLRYQDLGDAPDSYGTLAPSQGNLTPNGARHGGTRLNPNPVRLGQTVGYGESDGRPTVEATGDDDDASTNTAFNFGVGIDGDGQETGQISINANNDRGDDEDGAVRIAHLGSADDREVIRVLRIEAPAGGKLDAWIDFNQNGVFDSTEHLWEGVSVTLDESNVSETEPGVYYIKFKVPKGAVNFDGGVDEKGKPITLEEISTYARFRISSAGGLAPTGFALDGEVEDYRWTVRNISGSTPSFDNAANLAMDLFIDEYAAELIEDPNYIPPVKGEAGYVPFVFSGSGSGDAGGAENASGPKFERGETDPALAEIVAKINSLMSADRGKDEMVFVFVIHPVDFVITDPQGRQVGQSNGQSYNQIGSNVSYTGNGPVELLVIRGASAGEYKMEFTGTGGVFRGGASLITSEGQQLSTFQGGLSLNTQVQLALDFTAPVSPIVFDNVADNSGSGKGQVFFNVKDGGAGEDEEDDLSALLGLDAENQSTGDMDPRAEILKWIRAVSNNSRAVRRVVLDELTPDWITETFPESQELVDQFWAGLGQSLLGGIPGQVYHLAEFLGVDVPMMFAPASESTEPEAEPVNQDRNATNEEQTLVPSSPQSDTAEAGPKNIASSAVRYFAGQLLSVASTAGTPLETAGSQPAADRRSVSTPAGGRTQD